MGALGFLLWICVALAFAFPRKFGAWIAEVREGMQDRERQTRERGQ